MESGVLFLLGRSIDYKASNQSKCFSTMPTQLSFIRRGGLGRADIRLSAAGEPEGGRGKAVIRRQSGGRVRGLDPRTYRRGAPGALGGSAPSKGELAVKRPPDTATPLKADMEPVQSVPTMKGAQR